MINVQAIFVESLTHYSQLAPNLDQVQLNKLMNASGSTKDVSGASISKTLESDVDTLRVTVSKFQA